MDPLARAALKARLLQELEALLEARLPHGPLTLEEIESVVEALGRAADQRLEELLIEEQTPLPTNRVACPHCQGTARFKRTSVRSVLTIHGRQKFTRRYHECGGCGHGFAPLDRCLGLGEHTATRSVRAWLAKYGCLDAFVTVPELLHDLRGLQVSESTVERTTIQVGQALLAAEAAAAPAPDPPRGGAGGARRRPRWGSAAPDRYYLALDGVFCPLREPWRKDGSRGPLQCRYGECKVGLLFQTEPRAGLDEGVRWRACLATLAKIEGFTSRLVALAQQHGVERAPELVVLGDGAEWIWHLAEQHFPQAVQIVDYWHTTQHLWKVAHARFGVGTPEAAEWVRVSEWYLNEDLVLMVRLRLQEWSPTQEEHRQLRDTEYGYFAANEERMRYRTFLRHGYQIGSGVLEATCRQLVTQRLKESGMHWREDTAEAVLALRARLKSTAPANLYAYC